MNMKTKPSSHTPARCERLEPDCCYPVWDRSNNLKAIGLCSLHGAAPDILKVAHELAQALADEIGVPLDECVGGDFMNYRAVIEKTERKP